MAPEQPYRAIGSAGRYRADPERRRRPGARQRDRRAADRGDPESGPSIRFYPDGSSSGGTVVLTGSGGRYEIGVDWLTGRVRIDDGSGRDEERVPGE
ncbi:GspH/FimT family pseudopilin [Marinobacterium aestuariivivens]|uniref:GspH/FimT family pseudopilin n=1 Tax=Marinobacterium aestuariivivens TaxID=1698799 RepID=A0ABW1ZUW9_9GAMM